MKVIITIVIIMITMISAREHETENRLQFLQIRCSPDCYFGQLCGDFCTCIWPNCVEKRQVHHEEKIDSHAAISRLSEIPHEEKEEINRKYSSYFTDIRNLSCCCGVLGISCGPCTPTLPGAQVGVGCCCTF